MNNSMQEKNLTRSETQLNIKNNFDGIDKNAKAMITGFEWTDTNGNVVVHPFVPPQKAHFFKPELFTDIKMWNEGLGKIPALKTGFMLTGPTGSGKSSIINQYASRINMPLMHINAYEGMEEHEFTGKFILVKNEMVWMDGPLTTAIRNGYWFLIDEIDLLDPSVQAGLNSILDGSPLQIASDKGQEVILQHPNFRFFATANTKGKGNVSGVYNGTQPGNEAAWDRFQGTEEVWYLKAEDELEIVELAFSNTDVKLNKPLIKAMVKVANAIRSQFIGNESSNEAKTLSSPMSTRTLLTWVALTYQYKALKDIVDKPSPAMYALERALGFRMEKAEKLAIEEITKGILSQVKSQTDLV